ncbi:MAG: hypothetical protein ABSG03_38265 [Bryobacteraceae bacterium]
MIASNKGIGPGVYYFTPAQIANFSEPIAGGFGTSGRKTFHGPGFFNVDPSLVASPAMNLDGATTSYGKIGGVVNNPRIASWISRGMARSNSPALPFSFGTDIAAVPPATGPASRPTRRAASNQTAMAPGRFTGALRAVRSFNLRNPKYFLAPAARSV